MSTTLRWTSADLEHFPDDGRRREIIDGELYVSKQPNWYHQVICTRLGGLLDAWSALNQSGAAAGAPGVIFAEDDDVAPDVVWVSQARLAAILAGGKLHAAPELVVEVLSPGKKNERRDRETKLKLYARRGVEEYWIVDWPRHAIDLFRRDGELLVAAAALGPGDTLASPLLPGFAVPLTRVFAGVPVGPVDEEAAGA
jgi:Uma2 family endonuclease